MKSATIFLYPSKLTSHIKFVFQASLAALWCFRYKILAVSKGTATEEL